MQRGGNDGLDAARVLADPSRLLPGEDAGAATTAQVAHWVRVYGELLAVKDTLLPELGHLVDTASPSARDEVDLDLALMCAERDRLQRRFDHWCAQAAAAGLDPADLVGRHRARAPHRAQAGTVMIGHLRFDVHAHDVLVEGHRRRLTPNEWRLLNYLLSRRGEVVSRQELASGAWGAGYRNRPGEVELYVSRLRKKIAQLSGSGPSLIQTVRGRGYCLSRE